NWGNSFLPGSYAGSYVDCRESDPERVMRDLHNQHLSRRTQRGQLDLLAQLNELHLARQEDDAQLEASIEAMEMAFRMQFEVPDAFDLRDESAATLALYGDGPFARGCLLARRLSER